MRPLADEIRPRTLDEVAGQKHLLGEGALLRRLIESGTSVNLIFYGPSGTGKTTIANIIAKRTEKALSHLMQRYKYFVIYAIIHVFFVPLQTFFNIDTKW